MGFEKGQPRPPGSGRKKGSKNIPKPKGVLEILNEKEIDPLVHLLQYCDVKSPLQPKDKARIWMEILSYCYAKPRADLKVEMDDKSQPQQIAAMGELGGKILEAIGKWNGSN